MTFDEFWSLLQTSLDDGMIIRNWTAAKGFTGEPFKIMSVLREAVVIKAPDAQKDATARAQDFRLIFEKWPEYVSRSFPRNGFRDDTWVSKYTISIIHHLIDSDSTEASGA